MLVFIIHHNINIEQGMTFVDSVRIAEMPQWHQRNFQLLPNVVSDRTMLQTAYDRMLHTVCEMRENISFNSLQRKYCYVFTIHIHPSTRIKRVVFVNYKLKHWFEKKWITTAQTDTH